MSYPFNAPIAIPLTKYRFANAKASKTGISEIVVPANIKSQLTADSEEFFKAIIPTIKVCCSGFAIVKTAGNKYSFQELLKESIPIVALSLIHI